MKTTAKLLVFLSAIACAASVRAAESPQKNDGFGLPAASGGRFQLMDRQDMANMLEGAAVSTETQKPGLDEMGSELPFSYDNDSWNSAREAVETGRISSERAVQAPQQEISTATAAGPLAPEPQVEFKESGTTLSVTGRKVITLNYSGKRYIKDQTTVTRAKSLSLFEITQQMQVRMQGKVGQKISVNVDYDDTKADKQDISVVYQGEPNETVQNISFGDIDLSLPATEFVSYNKQLFGIRADIKTSRLKMTFVGSRTKGTTKTKQFTGNTQFQKVDINDTSYLRRKYYDLTFGNKTRLPLKVNSEKIYIDRQTSLAVDSVTVFGITANDLAVQTSTYTGRFQLLNRGVDYVMDYSNGILTFPAALNLGDVIIIDYRDTNNRPLSNCTSVSDVACGNTAGLFKLIKTKDDIQVADTAEAGYRQELKTYYSIGQTNIVHDNATGNFSLKVQDLSHNFVGTSLNPTQVYPDNITVDFDQGIFRLTNPFGSEGAPTVPDAQVYAASPSSKRLFHVEYNYRFKTFTLEANMVLNSEVVRVDGVKYTRNTDYFIDYDSGFITFYYPEKIGQDSKIDISYEVSAFGGAGNQSLVGGRASYDLGSHFSLGSTLLYQGGIKGNTVPNVTDLVNSMMVYEGDAQLKGLNLLGLRTTVGGELAQSKLTPNLNDAALIDNMEGVKQEDSAGLDKNYWVIASNPSGDPADPNAITWVNETLKAKDINPNSTSDSSQQVLTVNYDFSISSEVSIAYPLSTTGLDFSQKKSLEMIIFGENSGAAPGPQINIHYGQIDENADGTGGQNFTCSSGLTLFGAPKSEDINCDGQVAQSEDIGWLYAPEGKASKRYGAGNGRLDSEDLNANGRLDAQDFTGGDFGYFAGTVFSHAGSPQNAVVDFSGWRTITADMPIASTDSFKWNAIKQVRLSLRQQPGGAVRGTVKFARIAAVGNTWVVQQSTAGGSLQVSALNNVDNTNYIPIYNAGGDASKVFTELYGSVSALKQQNNTSVISEQTLAINYNAITSTSTGFVFRTFSTALDISQHAKLRFLVNNAGAADSNARFFLRAGSETSYFKASVKLDFTGWRLIVMDQVDLTKDSIPDIWTNGSDITYSVTASSVGSPSLQQISQLTAGIEVTDGGEHTGTVYFNELHLQAPIARTGNARKVEGSVEIPGWMTVGAKNRFVDRGFQTPVTAITNQDNETSNAYLNLTRMSFFPINVTAAKQRTVTPNAAATGSNNLVTALQEGVVKRFDGTASGTLGAGAFPKVGMNYTKGVIDYSLLNRKDDNDTYAANFAYSVPGSVFLLPRTINANYSLAHNLVNFDASRLLQFSGPSGLSGLFNTDDRTDIYGGKLTFVPWKGSSFNPSYSLQTVQEKRAPLSDPTALQRFPKSMQQTVDVNSNFLLTKWFNPSANYSVTTMENNNLDITTVTVAQSTTFYAPGQIKAITRSAQGGVNLALNMNEIMPSSKLLRSMALSSSYQIQDGDSWSNVEDDFDTRSKLWLRDPFKPKNPFAIRNSVTLRDTVNSNQRWQPLEGYGFKGSAAALNTLSITNNYTNSIQRSVVTQTESKSINRTFPDMIVSLSQLELLTHTRRWMQNSTLNVKYSHNTTEAVDVSLQKADSYGGDLRFKLLDWMDTAASYNLKISNNLDIPTKKITQDVRHNDATLQGTFDYRKFRFTPKVDYVSDKTVSALGVVTADTRVTTPSLLIKSDFTLPRGLKLPFTNTVLMLTNRIVWTTTFSYAIKSSPITIADNNSLFSLNTSADYEAAKNLRLTLNAGLQRLWSKHLKEEEYISYQAGSTLTFQF